ncbi:MAG: hypothetical protein ABFD64_03210 [Armatimonadota bacterium]
MLTSKRAIVALMVFVLVFGASISVFAVERTLAGIRLGSPAQTVLKKYGNPTRITTQTANTGNPGEGQPQNQPAGSLLSNMPGSSQQQTGPIGQLGQSYANGSSGSYAPLPGVDTGAPGAPGTSGNNGTQQNQPTESTVSWTYDLQSGTTLEFLISESGRVIQITVGGDQPFALSKTSKGIKLGSYYKDVIFKYGYPEKQQSLGRFLMAKYTDKHRCLFIFLEKKLVGITIAFNPEDE